MVKIYWKIKCEYIQIYLFIFRYFNYGVHIIDDLEFYTTRVYKLRLWQNFK